MSLILGLLLQYDGGLDKPEFCFKSRMFNHKMFCMFFSVFLKPGNTLKMLSWAVISVFVKWWQEKNFSFVVATPGTCAMPKRLYVLTFFYVIIKVQALSEFKFYWTGERQIEGFEEYCWIWIIVRVLKIHCNNLLCKLSVFDILWASTQTQSY